ncbi:uncharacterized protein KD926_000155 [Aspergillus affinis]|uniref:uncharacterized protein n=1 Tax=Aspergillus affinis TaxID=1070780 RepID=UPI0022FE62D2|nr:uncharacterized protein KD926_000155 [Aspergillus affinis]KAI9037593.1 hypothetical protein KD926_000155 [Aspergillus affinis]
MKTSLILPVLALFSAGFAVALPAAEAQDNTDPQSDPGEVGTAAIIRGCGARHTCNIDTVRLTAVCS